MHAQTKQARVLLAVLAHPDDETFGMGGTLALYAQQGAQVYLVCATRGEEGEMDPEYMQGFESIAQRREHELRCAAQKLGLAGVFFLGYRDSGMPGSPSNQNPRSLVATPVEQVAAQVVFYIRKLRPQVVITFDPVGGYYHPDHIAIHQATVLAFDKSGDPTFVPGDLPPYQPDKLYFHTMPRGLLRLAVRLMPLFGRDPHKFGVNQDIDLAKLAVDDFPVHAVIDYSPVRLLKEEASACHESQGGAGMARGLIGRALRLVGSKEQYMRAYPPPASKRKERDLFADIKP